MGEPAADRRGGDGLLAVPGRDSTSGSTTPPAPRPPDLDRRGRRRDRREAGPGRPRPARRGANRTPSCCGAWPTPGPAAPPSTVMSAALPRRRRTRRSLKAFRASSPWRKRGVLPRRAVGCPQRTGPDLLDAVLLQDQPVGITTSSAGVRDVRAGALAAIDGDVGTTWVAGPDEVNPQVRLSWLGRQRITGVALDVAREVAAREPQSLRITWPGGSRTVELESGRARFPAIGTDGADPRGRRSRGRDRPVVRRDGDAGAGGDRRSPGSRDCPSYPCDSLPPHASLSAARGRACASTAARMRHA